MLLTRHADPVAAFGRDGFGLIPALLDSADCAYYAAAAQPAAGALSGGTRNLLTEPWCVALADQLQQHSLLKLLLPNEAVAVQCTYFQKSASRNWLVPIHQDLSIPVAGRVDEPTLGAWAMKEGTLFVQPPVAVLEQLVAVRVHLDDCLAQDGPLRVVPGSHRQGVIEPEHAHLAKSGEVLCEALQGHALVMRPLLLHASSKSSGTGLRRVLHFVFGPKALPFGLRWRHCFSLPTPDPGT